MLHLSSALSCVGFKATYWIDRSNKHLQMEFLLLTCRLRPETGVESGQILRLRNVYLRTLDLAFWVVF